LPKIHIDWDENELDLLDAECGTRVLTSRPSKSRKDGGPVRRKRTRLTRPPRSEADQAFKCGHCKQFIGAPIAGGRHRNHCPNCLYSRHVDDTMPGDRKSDCHALMTPTAILTRRNGEQVIIHRCLGCGKEDPNRIAADDNPLLLMRLAPISSPGLELVPMAIDDIEETA
jgi:hypothetical protein